MTGLLSDKVAVVTGGGVNIGRAVARRFAAEGARVVVCGRRSEFLNETVRLIEANGGEALATTADVTVLEDMERVATQTLERFGTIDTLAAIAGGGHVDEEIDEIDPEWWVQTILANIVGTFHATRAVLPTMRAKNSGTIVTCAGGGALFPTPGTCATDYATAKAGICRFTDQLAVELMDTGIRVNCMLPGMTWPEERLATIAAEEARTGEPHPNREHNRPPEESAELALWLASDASDPLFGRTILASEDWWRDAAKVQTVHHSYHRSCLRRVEPVLE